MMALPTTNKGDTTMQIDWSKVKKSPVPKGAAGVNYYRGSGVRIHVYNTSMAVYVDGADKVLSREGDYTETATGEIKKLAAAMLNKAQQDANPPWEEIGHTHPAPSSGRKPLQRITPKARMNPAHQADRVVQTPLNAMFARRNVLA
jgi:hypothetical protein